MLVMSGLERLEERREVAFLKFAKKTSEGRFRNWFPKRERTRTLRGQKTYIEQYARCDRLYKTPIFAMSRLLNENERDHWYLLNGTILNDEDRLTVLKC